MLKSIWKIIYDNPLIYEKLLSEINSQYKNKPNISEEDIVLDSSEEQWINTIDFDSQVESWLGDILLYEANINVWGLVNLRPFMTFEILPIEFPLPNAEDAVDNKVIYSGKYMITQLDEKFSTDGYITTIKGMKVIV